MRLPLAREGIPFVLVCALVAATALLWAHSGGWGLRSAVPALSLALAVFAAYFFRDPERSSPADPGVVVAPADGKVVGVGPAGEPVGGSAGRAATRISIFLSIFDVHVQRAPMAGRVTEYSYRPGRYLAAWHPEAGRVNEQASLESETDAGPIEVRQIAGLVARRIVTYPRGGDRVEKGERIGLIRFGSRVELLVPRDWRVTVRAGDRVRGGATPVALAPAGASGARGESP